MHDINVGDRVRLDNGDLAEVLSVGSEAVIYDADGTPHRCQLDGVKAYVKLLEGPAAGKPYGYRFEAVGDLTHV
ncbi:hypothetical protein QLQ78_gp59 [Gordonia phage Jojo24]|uniref:Uncharacterized protein n=1 Tax=Gordonia phage Jojo24 TaxID=2859476 RepID=A0AAE7SL74_9CAUD|nr:hypothetical protein QLQ78_gp59 [Gordonia phage Jojo24]QXO13156.1 hypothetical protein SEA_JOJO24_59 [Gordonia phage Jojo24]